MDLSANELNILAIERYLNHLYSNLHELVGSRIQIVENGQQRFEYNLINSIGICWHINNHMRDVTKLTRPDYYRISWTMSSVQNLLDKADIKDAAKKCFSSPKREEFLPDIYNLIDEYLVKMVDKVHSQYYRMIDRCYAEENTTSTDIQPMEYSDFVDTLRSKFRFMNDINNMPNEQSKLAQKLESVNDVYLFIIAHIENLKYECAAKILKCVKENCEILMEDIPEDYEEYRKEYKRVSPELRKMKVRTMHIIKTAMEMMFHI